MFFSAVAKPTPRGRGRGLASGLCQPWPFLPAGSPGTPFGDLVEAHAPRQGRTRRNRAALRSRFCIRSATGSISSASASLFICISAAKTACGAPKPRKAPLGGLLV